MAHVLQMQLEAARAAAARDAVEAEGRAWAERVARADTDAVRERKECERLQAELRAVRRGVPWTPKAAEVGKRMSSSWRFTCDDNDYDCYTPLQATLGRASQQRFCDSLPTRPIIVISINNTIGLITTYFPVPRTMHVKPHLDYYLSFFLEYN